MLSLFKITYKADKNKVEVVSLTLITTNFEIYSNFLSGFLEILSCIKSILQGYLIDNDN